MNSSSPGLQCFAKSTPHRLIRNIQIVMLAGSAFSGCSEFSDQPTQVQIGSSKETVVSQVGEPDEVNEFVLPKPPFFGPQESLTSVLDPGTTVEEWIYHVDGNDVFIWFAVDAGQEDEIPTVVKTSTYPAGAVF